MKENNLMINPINYERALGYATLAIGASVALFIMFKAKEIDVKLGPVSAKASTK